MNGVTSSIYSCLIIRITKLLFVQLVIYLNKMPAIMKLIVIPIKISNSKWLHFSNQSILSINDQNANTIRK